MHDNRLLTLNRFLILFLVSVLTVVFANVVRIFEFITNSDIKLNDIIDSDVLSSTTEPIEKLLVSIITPDVATFIVWFIVGMTVYILLNTAFDTTKSLKDTFSVAFNFVHPANFSQKSYWLTFLLSVVEGLAISLLFLIWTYLTLKYFLVFSSDSLGVALSQDIFVSDRFMFAAYSILGVFVTLLGFDLLYKLLKIYKTPS